MYTAFTYIGFGLRNPVHWFGTCNVAMGRRRSTCVALSCWVEGVYLLGLSVRIHQPRPAYFLRVAFNRFFPPVNLSVVANILSYDTPWVPSFFMFPLRPSLSPNAVVGSTAGVVRGGLGTLGRAF